MTQLQKTSPATGTAATNTPRRNQCVKLTTQADTATSTGNTDDGSAAQAFPAGYWTRLASSYHRTTDDDGL